MGRTLTAWLAAISMLLTQPASLLAAEISTEAGPVETMAVSPENGVADPAAEDVAFNTAVQDNLGPIAEELEAVQPADEESSFTSAQIPLPQVARVAQVIEMESRLEQIGQQLVDAETVDPASLNPREVGVANNYIRALSVLAEQIARTTENPGLATPEQRVRMGRLFQIYFPTMLSRAERNQVDIATEAAGRMLSTYIRSGLARTTDEVLDLYTQLRRNQDRLLGRLSRTMTDARTTDDFWVPYVSSMQPFDGNIGGIAAALTNVEADLVTLLSRRINPDLNYNPDPLLGLIRPLPGFREEFIAALQNWERVNALLQSASDRTLSLQTFYSTGHGLGIEMDDLSPVTDPIAGLYGSWAGVMRAGFALIDTIGRTRAYQSTLDLLYSQCMLVSSRTAALIDAVFPRTSLNGIWATRAMLENSAFFYGRFRGRNDLSERYQDQFRALMDRFVEAANAERPTDAGTIRRLNDTLDFLIGIGKSLGMDLWSQWVWDERERKLYSLGRCVQAMADRVAGMDWGSAKTDAFDRVAQSVGSFSYCMIDMLRDGLFGAFFHLDPIEQRRTITSSILDMFTPVMDRLASVVEAVPDEVVVWGPDNRRLMESSLGFAQLRLGFLERDVQRILDGIPAPRPGPAPLALATEPPGDLESLQEVSITMTGEELMAALAAEEPIQETVTLEETPEEVPVI